MKRIILFILGLLINTFLLAQVHVKGYYRKNGTYVQPYVRSSPDGNPYNNYSYPGNTNPYTGKVAAGNPNTYLARYYNNSAAPDTKYYINDYGILTIGNYLKFWTIEADYIAYNVFDASDSYIGFLAIYSTKKLSIFDTSNKLVREVENFDSPLSSLPNGNNNSQTAYNKSIDSYTPYPYRVSSNNSHATTGTYYKSTKYLPQRLSERKLKLYQKIYLKDKNGNYSDFYLIVDSVDETVTKYTVYNHNDTKSGTISEFVNGEIFIYNRSDTLVKHIKP
jgi:hypothetical protein